MSVVFQHFEMKSIPVRLLAGGKDVSKAENICRLLGALLLQSEGKKPGEVDSLDFALDSMACDSFEGAVLDGERHVRHGIFQLTWQGKVIWIELTTPKGSIEFGTDVTLTMKETPISYETLYRFIHWCGSL